MAASVNDKFTKVGSPGTATTLSAPGYTIADTTINVASTANWPDDTETKVIFAIDRAEVVDGAEVRISGTYNEFEGIVSASGVISSLSKRYGTAQDYVAGSLTRVYIPVASTRENDLIDGLEQDHNLKGNHKSLTDENDNEWLERGSVAGAVNHAKATNAATGNKPKLGVAGGDTNIGLEIELKGTGELTLPRIAPPAVSSSDYTLNSTDWESENIKIGINGALLWVRFVATSKTTIDDTTTEMFTLDLAALGIDSSGLFEWYGMGWSDGANRTVMLRSTSAGVVQTMGVETASLPIGSVVQGTAVIQIATWD